MSAQPVASDRQDRTMTTPTSQLISQFGHWYASRGKSPGTVYVRCRYVSRLDMEIGISAATADQIADWLMSRPWAPETRKSARESLTVFWDWAITHGHLPGPSPMADIPPCKLPPPCPHPTTDTALARARLAATPDERLMIDLGALAGLRRSEIAAARTDWLEDDTLRVRGKGGRVRVVPLPPELAARIKKRPAGWLFPGRFAGHISSDFVGRHLSRLLGSGLTAHSLRHRYASRAYDATGDLLAVQQLLGHSRPETTQRYVQLGRSRLRAAALAAS